MLTCYAQGFALMREASKEYGYDLDLQEIARIWKGGCIIRARVLDSIRAAFAADPNLANLLVAEPFSRIANDCTAACASVVAKPSRRACPCLALAASLGYIDSYRRERLPANLLQGQRDYFGAHKYERMDKPRGQSFHTIWTE